jgi:hypothetical protein
MFPGEHLDPLFIPKLMQDERKSKGSEVLPAGTIPHSFSPAEKRTGNDTWLGFFSRSL